jgi:hypothetical protein
VIVDLLFSPGRENPADEVIVGIGPEWRPFPAVVMDWRTCVFDYRTRPSPFAMIVDAINTDKDDGGGHEKPSLEAAKRSIERAIEFMRHALDQKSSISAAHVAVHCLFALRALKLRSPVVFMVGHRDASNIAELLSAALQAEKSVPFFPADEMRVKIVEALMALGGLLPDDDDVRERLFQERSLAYSADMPGIVMFVDVFRRDEIEELQTTNQ